MMSKKTVLVDLELMQGIVNFLQEQPYRHVAQLLQGIIASPIVDPSTESNNQTFGDSRAPEPDRAPDHPTKDEILGKLDSDRNAVSAHTNGKFEKPSRGTRRK